LGTDTTDEENSDKEIELAVRGIEDVSKENKNQTWLKWKIYIYYYS